MDTLLSRLQEIDEKFDRLNEVVTPLMPLADYLQVIATLEPRLLALEKLCLDGLPAKEQQEIAQRSKEMTLATIYPDFHEIHKELGNLRKDMHKFMQDVQSTVATKAELGTLQTPITTIQTRPKDPKIAVPEAFGGKRENCKLFLAHLQLYFGAFPTTYTGDREKIRFALSYLTDAAQKYFLPFADRLDLPEAERPEPIRTFESFSKTLTATFGIYNSDIWAETQLRTLRQTGSAVEYTSRFRTYMSMTSWNDSALCAQYVLGLKDSIAAKLSENERILEFEKLVKRVHEIDGQQTAYAAQRNSAVRTTPVTSSRTAVLQIPPATRPVPPRFSVNPPRNDPSVAEPVPTTMPMDLTQVTRVSPQEMDRRRRSDACFYCGAQGHHRNQCTKRPQQRTLNTMEDSAIEFELVNENA